MGTLFLVATPIGNLSDVSARTREVLEHAHAIACEDTRTSSILLRSLGITSSLIPFHQHNEHKKLDTIMRMLESGQDIALISDAGTPGISDPGFLAVREAHRRGLRVSAIPGPSALTTALAMSGLPADRFLFEGFLPPKKGRKTRLETLAEYETTTVLFESVHRISRLMGELKNHCEPTRMIAVCRELTKQFEEVIRGPLDEVYQKMENHTHLKGEFVVVLAGKNYKEE
ncbi:16S rRNA (cytidine(1402)-2'-O)-methyltransferase [Balneolaceae bacterium ANBcel3]|nr:16S rRNA (cytidine(1402)-2'-O)-methyltransferase [Balneolaceae bacterium ANBcel3]